MQDKYVLIDCKKEYWWFGLVLLVIDAFGVYFWFVRAKNGAMDTRGAVGVLFSVVLWVMYLYRMSEKVTADADGICYKIGRRTKRYAWSEISGYGIARITMRSRRAGTVDRYTLFVSNSSSTLSSVSKLGFDGVRVTISTRKAKALASVLHELARRYATVEPKIEIWG